MPSALYLNPAAPSSARLRQARVADGVVAGYIRQLSRTAHVGTDAAPRAGRSRSAAEAAGRSRSAAEAAVRTAGSRVRAGGRRRSHAPGVWRPLTATTGCPGA